MSSHSKQRRKQKQLEAARSAPFSTTAFRKITSTRIAAKATFSSPLPPPALLAEYEKIQAGLVERIVTMAEKAAEHRRAMETGILALEGENLQNRQVHRLRGQWFGFGVAIIGILAGAATAALGHEWGGSAIGVAGVGGIVATFVIGRQNRAETPQETTVPDGSPPTPPPPQPAPPPAQLPPE